MTTAHIRGLTIDVSDRDRAERFWGGLLGLTVTRRIDQYSYFDDAAEGIRLILQEVPDPKVAKNRVHLDLSSDDPQALLDEVVSLGGRVISSVEDPSYSLTVACDPDGNEFCVVGRLSAGLADEPGGPEPAGMRPGSLPAWIGGS